MPLRATVSISVPKRKRAGLFLFANPSYPDNLLLFFSANEVINARNNTNAAPYIKAVTRDIRNYIRAQSSRPIPVGYSSADVAENIEAQANYFACGEDEIARSDFFAFNDYSWCDPSDFRKSGWDQKVQTYKNYSLPIFLSEFGCITNRRDWNEIAALYSENMTIAYSGGLAYEYTLEANGYGLVEMGSDGKAVPNEDFDRLKAAYAATPNPTGDGGATRDARPVPECPPESDEWHVSTALLPAMPEGAEKFMKDGAGAGPGLDADTQWAGTPTTTAADLSDGVSTTEAEDTNYSASGSGGNGGNGGNSTGGGNESGAASLSFSPAAVMTVAVLAAVFAVGL